MKHQFIILASCTLLLLAAGCKKTVNEPDSVTPDPEPQPEVVVLTGNVARPTDWTVSEDYDYSSSMTAVVRVDLMQQYPDAAQDFVLTDDDLLGAFGDDGTCLGVVSPDEEGLFYLFIAGPTSVSEAVILRYWSGHYSNLFVAEPFPFVNDGQQGSYAEPYVPDFRKM